MQLSPVPHRSLDELESDIVSHAQRMNVLEYEFHVLIREFDIRQGWKANLSNSCAEWLNWRCGIELATAREKVRVALALFDLPKISVAFETGRLSYSKVRSLTRVATRCDEEELVEHAFGRTASQVDDYCRQLRNAQRRLSTPDVNRAHRARYLSCNHRSDGSSFISVDLPREMADLVMKAIELATIEIDQEQAHEQIETDSYFARQADALMAIVRSYLGADPGKGPTQAKKNTTSTADHYQLIVHVDEAALNEAFGGKSDLPIESVRRIGCDTRVIRVIENEAGDPVNVGRKHRVVSPPLKRALLSRDRCCRFPGCTHDKWLDAHHVKHWINGGETSLANILLICSHHHRLLHEGEFTIQKDFTGNWYFRSRTGRIIPEAPIFRELDEVDKQASGVVNPPRGGLEEICV